ncbi:putative calcium-binding protein CML45 [Citrus sinensis]|nr:putative calcium-binding protein CML45 [Citrus sinensis]
MNSGDVDRQGYFDPSDVRKQNGSFGDPFVEHEKQFKNMPEKIQKWRAALTEASNLSGWDSMTIRFLLYSSFLQSVQSCKSRNWDEKSKQASFNKKEHDDESLSRDEVEMVMRKLTLFCSFEDEELPQKLGSAELSWLFEEKEPSLEEVKEAFDVFDENKDGFIDAMELQRLLCILGLKEGFELENCKKMIKTFDKNGDGRIDFKEFVKFMEKSFVES